MELPIFNTYTNFSHHHFCCFTVVPLFVLDKVYGLKIGIYNTLASKYLCKIAQAFKNSDSKAQHLPFRIC